MTETTRRTALVGAALGGPLGAAAPAVAGTAQIVPRGEGRSWWMVGDRLTLVIPAEATGGAFSLMDIFVVPGGGPPPHIHTVASETFRVIEGEVTLLVGERTVRAGPGATVHVPAGVPHNFRNEGGVPARMLMVIAPAGLERLFMEAGVPTAADNDIPAPADEGRIAAILAVAERNGTVFLPPGR